MSRSTLGIGSIHLGAVAGLVIALTGCAVHPLPQDVTYASTVQIISRIRCEAREGLEAAVAQAAAVSPRRKQHVEQIVNNTSIGLEFTFVMAESNKLEADKIELERVAANGERLHIELVGRLNEDHGAFPNNTRKNVRVFRIVDDLKELAQARCSRRGQKPGPNLFHPIAGSTGMADVVRSYIELETLTDLNPSEQRGKMVAFTDSIDFTTTLDTSASIDVEFNAGVGRLRLTKVLGNASALRHDVHSVDVVLAREKNAPDLDLPEHLDAVRDKDLQTFLAQTRAKSRNKVLLEFTRQRKAAEDRAVAERVLGRPVP